MKLFTRRKDYTQTDDRTLADACAAGKADAQRAFYEKFKRKIFGVCLRYAPDKTTAEDLLQESFIKAFEKMKNYDGRGSLEGWLRKITLGTCIDYFRQNRRNVLTFETPPDFADGSAELAVLARLDAETLVAMARRLPEGYRMVFNLFIVEEYTHAEIADALGISEGASKSQLSRARKALLALLEKEEAVCS